MNRTVIQKMVQIYDNLIEIATENLNKNVSMDWGTWTPSQRCIDTMKSRRNKLKFGKATLSYFTNRLQ